MFLKIKFMGIIDQDIKMYGLGSDFSTETIFIVSWLYLYSFYGGSMG